MRNQIFDAIHRRMATDPRIFLVIADMGINLVDKIARDYPARFLNVGIAEQTLIGVCAGLVNGGYRPIAYTISNFVTERCFEQIRNDVAVHRYPITIIGASTGYENAPLGPTHHIVDEWGAIRTIAGVEIHCPSSVPYAEPLFDSLIDRSVMAYVRIPKGEYTSPASSLPVVHLPGSQAKVLLATYGGLAQTCLEVQRQVPAIGVMVFNRLRPVDGAALADIWSGYERVIIVEDHFAETGLYSTACRVVAEHHLPTRLESRAPSEYYMDVGTSQDYFWKKFRGDTASLVSDLR